MTRDEEIGQRVMLSLCVLLPFGLILFGLLSRRPSAPQPSQQERDQFIHDVQEYAEMGKSDLPATVDDDAMSVAERRRYIEARWRTSHPADRWSLHDQLVWVRSEFYHHAPTRPPGPPPAATPPAGSRD